MKFLIFTFYIFSVLPILFLQSMEKETEYFQPKSLQTLCIKPFYAPALNDEESQKTGIYSTENINTLNKKFPLTIYPLIAYHIIKSEKVCVRNKYALISFLRDFPEKHEPKNQKILNFFTEFIETNNYYHSTLLAVAIQHSTEPFIVNFLLKNGEMPISFLVWELIGKERSRPDIHPYDVEKLAYLLKFNVPLTPRPHSAFIPSSGLSPLEYAQNMVTCWQDTVWTKGYQEKEFNKHFRPKLCEAQSQETIDAYKKFFSDVVDLFITYESKKAK